MSFQLRLPLIACLFVAGGMLGYLYSSQSNVLFPENNKTVLGEAEMKEIRGGQTPQAWCRQLPNCNIAPSISPACNGKDCTGLEAGDACKDAPAEANTAYYFPEECNSGSGNEKCGGQTVEIAACSLTKFCTCQPNQEMELGCFTQFRTNCINVSTDTLVCYYLPCP